MLFLSKDIMMKPFPQQGLNEERRIYNNLEAKFVEDIVLTALTLHNMLLKSAKSTSVYRTSTLADNLVENGEIAIGEWRFSERPREFT